MKILITGSTGLLGQALVNRLARADEVTGVSRRPPSAPSPSRHLSCDLRDGEAVRRMVEVVQPEAVIHTQAMSDVDRCEREPSEAAAMNVETIRHLCAAVSPAALVVSLSTDYVFDGATNRPYNEWDRPHPVSVYGRSKLEAEQVALAHPRGCVVRPSTLFGPARMNFCDLIVQRARQGQPVEAFTDQTTSPTYTEDLAEALGQLTRALAARQGAWPSRVYHLTNAGACPRVEFARRVLELLGAPAALLKPIRMADQRRPAPRPPYSALTSRYVTEVLGRTLRPWDEALHAYLASLRSTR